MKKITLNGFASLDKISIKEFEIDSLAPNEVIVKNSLIGFNPVDYKIYEGSNLIAKKIEDKLPWTLGFDICGTVIKIHESSSRFKIGDRVCGMIGFPFEGGAYSTHSKVKEEQLAIIPNELADKEAITCCLSGLTAFQAYKYIKDSTNPVLVLGATGAVGFSLLSLLSSDERKAFGTYRDQAGLDFISEFKSIVPLKIDQLDELYNSESVDVIDLIGGEVVSKLIASRNININTLVTIPTYSQAQIQEEAKVHHIKVEHFIVKESIDDLKNLLEIMNKNKITLKNFSEFYLEDIKGIFDSYNKRATKGKVLIKPM